MTAYDEARAAAERVVAQQGAWGWDSIVDAKALARYVLSLPPASDEAVERGARALVEASGIAWDVAFPDGQATARRHARAVLAAAASPADRAATDAVARVRSLLDAAADPACAPDEADPESHLNGWNWALHAVHLALNSEPQVDLAHGLVERGWWCSRAPGHDGPCAPHEAPWDARLRADPILTDAEAAYLRSASLGLHGYRDGRVRGERLPVPPTAETERPADPIADALGVLAAAGWEVKTDTSYGVLLSRGLLALTHDGTGTKHSRGRAQQPWQPADEPGQEGQP